MVNFNDPRKKNLTNAKHFGSLHPGKNFLPTQKHYPHKKDILTHLAHETHVKIGPTQPTDACGPVANWQQVITHLIKQTRVTRVAIVSRK